MRVIPRFSAFSDWSTSIRARFGRALKHRNYRLFFTGQSISLIGTWLTRVATSWLVYRLTKSAFMLGFVSFAGQIPMFLFASVAGVWVDRLNRHHILKLTQTLFMIQSALLAVFTISGKITITDIIALSVFQGFINTFDMPTRQAFVIQMVESREDLPNAIALNSSMVNMARLVGPSFAGILIATVGEGGCFAIDAVSYLAVIACLFMMRIKPQVKHAHERKRVRHELVEGVRYAISFRPVLVLLLMLAVASFMGLPYMVILPMIVARLHGNAALLGYLTAFAGLGALCGVLYLASRPSVLGLGRVIVMASATLGVGLMCFSLSRLPLISMFFIFFVGLGLMVQLAAGNTILQTIIDEDKRGRVMSLYAMAVAGMVPFGSLFAGTIAKYYGAPTTLFISGFTCTIAAFVFYHILPSIGEKIRPIYKELGILPPIDSEL